MTNADTPLAARFQRILELLVTNRVEYLLVGGFAVSYYGYIRTTADIDLWVAVSPENASNLVRAIREFGFLSPDLQESLFLLENKMIRMGNPPFRIEILTGISGVGFDECYRQRTIGTIDGVETQIISLKHLRQNKQASGRLKDLADLGNLPT